MSERHCFRRLCLHHRLSVVIGWLNISLSRMWRVWGKRGNGAMCLPRLWRWRDCLGVGDLGCNRLLPSSCMRLDCSLVLGPLRVTLLRVVLRAAKHGCLRLISLARRLARGTKSTESSTLRATHVLWCPRRVLGSIQLAALVWWRHHWAVSLLTSLCLFCHPCRWH